MLSVAQPEALYFPAGQAEVPGAHGHVLVAAFHERPAPLHTQPEEPAGDVDPLTHWVQPATTEVVAVARKVFAGHV